MYSQLSFGSNTDEDILHFLIGLQKILKDTHQDDYLLYIWRLVIVLDNASVHWTEQIAKFFEKSGIVGVTLPQYTPEMNPIEKFFGLVKKQMAKANLYE